MRILITGNLGYVGPGVVSQLRAYYPHASLVGLDTGYFAGCVADHLAGAERDLDLQYFADLRDIDPRYFKGVEAVVHLAGLSNDPIGNRFEAVTSDVNYSASMKLAHFAKDAGAKSFIFASSCSVYGSAEDTPRTERSDVAPLTAYARSKVAVENGLRELACDKFHVTCLRFATACGMSPRLRLDLVLNDFVASAATMGRIKVLSNGLPWRPLIHVRDMARAVGWAVTRPQSAGGNHLVMNTGSDAWTFQVRDLARATSARLSGSQVSINVDAPDDKRSYKVDFELFRRLAPNHQPIETLTGSIDELKTAMETLFTTSLPDPSRFIRLRTLSDLLDHGRLDSQLRWVRPMAAGSRLPELILAGRE